MKITVEDSKRCNIAVECKRLKTVSKRRGVNETNFLKADLAIEKIRDFQLRVLVKDRPRMFSVEKGDRCVIEVGGIVVWKILSSG